MRKHVARRDLSLADGDVGGCRNRSASRRIGDACGVSCSEDTVVAGNRERWVHEAASAFIFRDNRIAEHRRGLDAAGPHEQREGNVSPLVFAAEHGATFFDGFDAAIEPDRDAKRFEATFGDSRYVIRRSGKEPRSGFHEREVRMAGKPERFLDVVGQRDELSRELNAGRAAASHHDARFAQFLERGIGCRADAERVFKGFERERILAYARNAEVVRDCPECKNKVLSVDIHPAVAEADGSRRNVHGNDFILDESDREAGERIRNRDCGCAFQRDGCRIFAQRRCDFVEARRVGVGVVAVNEDDIVVVSQLRVSTQRPAEGPRGRKAGKAPAENDDVSSSAGSVHRSQCTSFCSEGRFGFLEIWRRMALMLQPFDALDIAGKRVLVRVDYNVATDDAAVVDDFRIRATLPTIRALRERRARAVLLLSHRGRPEGRDSTLSLRSVAGHLGTLLREPVRFVEDCIGPVSEKAARDAENGAVLLFENLRFHRGEEANDSVFADGLARLGDCYVNEAFGVSHRPHASVAALPQRLPSAAGLQLLREVEVLSSVRDKPKDPFVAVLGGKKIVDKLPLVAHFLPKVSALCLGGALANTALKAKGFAVGASVVEDGCIAAVRGFLGDGKLLLPIDAVVSDDTSGERPARMCGVGDVRENERILDIGPATIAAFARAIATAKTVFWNGPMGVAEVPAFRAGTEAIARAVAGTSGFSVVGGGDTTRYPLAMGLGEQISFLSTGGGAMLEFLSGKSLPGIAALEAL